MDFEHKLPAWSNEGVEPSDELKQGGFAGGYKPPATVFNYWWNKTSNAMSEVQDALADPDNHGGARVGLSNVDDSTFAAKALAAGVGGALVVEATSTDGVAYSATVSGMSSLSVGFELTIIPNMTSTSRTPTFNLNGFGAKRIAMPINGSNTAATTMPPIVYNDDTPQEDLDSKISIASNWLTSGKPVTIRYDGTVWETKDMPAQSAQHLYGVVPIESGGTDAKTPKEAVANLGIKRYVVDCGVNGNWDYEIYNDGTLEAHTKRTLSSWTLNAATYLYTGSLTIEDFPYYIDSESSIYTFASSDTPIFMGCVANVMSLFAATPTANTYFEITAKCPSSYGIITSTTMPVDINVHFKGKVVLDTTTITNNLTNVTTSNTKTVTTFGTSYSATLSCASTYTMGSVTVTMGGEDITASAYSNKQINIANVTGDIVITASATKTHASVTRNLTNVTSSNTASSVAIGSSYTTTLTANTGYTLGIPTIMMGGVAQPTANVYDSSTGVITIANVTGDILITMSATKALATKKYAILPASLVSRQVLVAPMPADDGSIGCAPSYASLLYNPDTNVITPVGTANTDTTPAGFTNHSNRWGYSQMAMPTLSGARYYGSLSISGVNGTAYRGYATSYIMSDVVSASKSLSSGWTNDGTYYAGTYEFAANGIIYYYE